jgi:hypothetical protein
MAKLTKFDKHDYECYAGVEGDNPMIAYLEHPEYETDGWVIVVDDEGITVYGVTMGDGIDPTYYLPCTHAEGEAVAKVLDIKNVVFMCTKGMKFKLC